jgi:adenine-specific DNA-methyltransferase
MMDLRNCDCLDLLRSLGDESVDLIIVDPPYYKILKDKWDNQWDNEADYLDWCKEWTYEAARVLRPERCLYVWGTTKHDTFLHYKLNVLNHAPGMIYQNWIIWSSDWGGRTRKTFPRKHEDLLMYSKGKKFLFNADDVRVPYKMKKNIRGTASNNPLGKVPTDVWMKNNHTTSKEYAGWHSAQKPIALLERIVKANTNPGDIVLDFFSGTGSTAVAALRHDRQFIGCEVDAGYYQKSLQRIKELL